jgi:hypothetical protein
LSANDRSEASPQSLARIAGLLYLAIIVLGLSGELAVRSTLIVPGDAAATAARITTSEGLFRLGFLADSVMFLCDVALGVLLYLLLRPVSKTVSLMAMCFRLTQAAVIAANLSNYYAASIVLHGSEYASTLEASQQQALAALFLGLHSHGYDIGLLSFGVSCLLAGYLVYRSGYLPKFLGVLLVAAGVTYLVASYTRFLFPQYVESITPIYAVAVLAEVSMCLWLLIKGVNAQGWRGAVSGSPSAV